MVTGGAVFYCLAHLRRFEHAAMWHGYMNNFWRLFEPPFCGFLKVLWRIVLSTDVESS
jgi:hypothetical protein